MKIIIDSTCGISKDDAEKLGWGFLPITFIYKNERFSEGVNADNEWVVDKLKKGDDISTSQPPIGLVEELIKKSSEENDHVIVFTLSKHLSGTSATASMISSKYENVYSVDTLSGGSPVYWLAKKAEKLFNEGKSFDEIIKQVNIDKTFLKMTFMPKDLKQLHKSGRVSGLKVLVGGIAGIVPLFSLVDGKVTQIGKARHLEKGLVKLIKNLVDNAQYFKKVSIGVCGTTTELVTFAKEQIKEILGLDSDVFPLSGSISQHTGIGTIAIMLGEFK